jgi:hypothetical protein
MRLSPCCRDDAAPRRGSAIRVPERPDAQFLIDAGPFAEFNGKYGRHDHFLIS